MNVAQKRGVRLLEQVVDTLFSDARRREVDAITSKGIEEALAHACLDGPPVLVRIQAGNGHDLQQENMLAPLTSLKLTRLVQNLDILSSCPYCLPGIPCISHESLFAM